MSLEQLRKEAEGKKPVLRTCWNCNPSHKHLKNYDAPIFCFVCGRWFYKGVDVTVEELSKK